MFVGSVAPALTLQRRTRMKLSDAAPRAVTDTGKLAMSDGAVTTITSVVKTPVGVGKSVTHAFAAIDGESRSNDPVTDAASAAFSEPLAT